MGNETVISLLEAHGVQVDVDEEGQTWAMDEFIKQGRDYSEWIDVTEWTKDDAKKWLGY